MMNITCVALVAVFLAYPHPVWFDVIPQDDRPSPHQAENSAAQKPNSPSGVQILRTAQLHFKNGEYAPAEKATRRAIKRQPENAKLHLLMADIRFLSGNIDGAIESYDRAIELLPNLKPQMWQRGLALYYAEKFKLGQAQFETHQTVNSQDVENAVWHLLCTSKIEDLETARKKLIPIERDTRVPMKEIYELFAGRMKPALIVQAAHAESKNDLALYYANLYLGLYHEMVGQDDLAERFINAAVAQSPDARDNLMMQLARIHQSLRAKQRQTKSPVQEPEAQPSKKSPSREGGSHPQNEFKKRRTNKNTRTAKCRPGVWCVNICCG